MYCNILQLRKIYSGINVLNIHNLCDYAYYEVGLLSLTWKKGLLLVNLIDVSTPRVGVKVNNNNPFQDYPHSIFIYFEY